MNIDIKQEPGLEEEGLAKRGGSPTTQGLDAAGPEDNGPEESLSDEGIGRSPARSEEEARPSSAAVQIPSEGLRLLEELDMRDINSHSQEVRSSSGSAQLPRQGVHLLTGPDREIFYCEKCTMAFTQETHLLRHKKMFHSFFCQYCGKQFASDSDCIKHEDGHNAATEYSCNECNLIFENNAKLQEHYGKHLFACSHCDKTYTNNIALLTHEQTHRDENLSCNICGKVFKNSSNLQLHQCKCKFLNVRSRLSGHRHVNNEDNTNIFKPKRGSDKYFHCTECPKAFSSSQDFAIHTDMHTVSHTEEAKFPVRHQSDKYMQDVNKGHFPLLNNLNDQDSLIREENIGKDDKVLENSKNSIPVPKRSTESRSVFKCTRCEKTYARKGDLTKHMKRKHYNHPGKQTNNALQHQKQSSGSEHVCKESVSAKKFSNTINLMRHMKFAKHEIKGSVEDSELVKPVCSVFSCKVCSKVFALKPYLNKHIKRKHPELKSGLGTKEKGHKESECNLKVKVEHPATSPESKCGITASETGRFPKTFKCRECPNVYGRKYHLLRHIKHKHAQQPSIGKRESVSSSSAFRCKICSKTFPKQYSLNVHMKLGKHANDSSIQCSICSTIFKERRYLLAHMRRKHRGPEGNNVKTGGMNIQNRFKCPLCPKNYGRKNNMKEHMKKKHPESIQQKLSRDQPKTHDQHKEVVSNEVVGTPSTFFCSKCPKTFLRLCDLNKHLNYYKHMCKKEIESMVVKTQSDAMSNVSQPFGHICRICSKGYSCSSSLKRHMKDGHPEHQCQECLKAFSRRRYLAAHMKRKHPGSEIRNKPAHRYSASSCQCSQCQKTFPNKFSLTMHIKLKHKSTQHQHKFISQPEQIRESRNVLFHCGKCSRVFARKCDLTVHMRRGLHHSDATNMPLFQCPKCPINFCRKENFCNHMKNGKHQPQVPEDLQNKVETAVSSYQCSLCSRSFATKGDLKKHGHYCKQQGHLKKNLAIDHGSSFHCSTCSKSFASQGDLKSHTRSCCYNGKVTVDQSDHVEQEEASGSKIFGCPQCPRSFKRAAYLQKHMDSKHSQHERNASRTREDEAVGCSQQEKKLSRFSKGLLSDSKSSGTATTSSEKAIPLQMTWNCPECGKHFASRADLKRHQDTHIFMCNYCHRFFTTQMSLDEHACAQRRDAHKCKQCLKNFENAKQLGNHKCRDESVFTPPHTIPSNPSKLGKNVSVTDKRIASNSSKPPKNLKMSHKCELCQKIFRSSRELTAHEEQHTLTEFEDDASSTISETSTKPAHVMIPNKMLQCRFCDTAFPSLELVHNHERSHMS